MVVNIRETPFKKTTSKKIIRNEFFNEKKENIDEKSDVRLIATEQQKKVYNLCCHCIGHSDFGTYTNLYTVGLDSLSSILLLTDLNDKLGASLTLTELMENPTVEQICQKLDEKSHNQSNDYSVRTKYPLTRLQMHFAYVMRGNTTTNLPFFFKLASNISLDKMEDSIKKTL